MLSSLTCYPRSKKDMWTRCGLHIEKRYVNNTAYYYSLISSLFCIHKNKGGISLLLMQAGCSCEDLIRMGKNTQWPGLFKGRLHWKLGEKKKSRNKTKPKAVDRTQPRHGDHPREVGGFLGDAFNKWTHCPLPSASAHIEDQDFAQNHPRWPSNQGKRSPISRASHPRAKETKALICHI